MLEAPKVAPDDKLVTQLLNLWMHQNTLLWGRVQLISAIQAGVVGGWFTLFSSDRYRYAALIALLGAILSLAVYAIIDCDLDWRRDIKKRLVEADPRIFPEKTGAISGYTVIISIAIGFFWLDVILFAVTIVTKATVAGWIESFWRGLRSYG
jgi:hypothetical protein